MKSSLFRNVPYRSLLFYAVACVITGALLLTFYADISLTLKPLYMCEFICMDVLALLSLYWIAPSRMRGATVCLVWLLALLLGANSMYHRYWGSLLSVGTIFNPASYNSFVTGAVSNMICARDLLYLLFPALLTILWMIMRRRKDSVIPPAWRITAITLSVLLFFAAGFMRVRRYKIYLHDIGFTERPWSLAFDITYKTFGTPSGLNELHRQGLTVYSVSQLISALTPRHITLDDSQRESIRQFIASSPSPVVTLADNRDKNLIMIIVESLNADYIGRNADHGDITPTLSSLLTAEGTISNLNIITQTGEGGSSDGQMMYNTGLLPIKSGAAPVKFGDNTYPSLAHTFADRMSVEVIPEPRHVWNHDVTSVSYGYRRLLDKKDLLAAGHDDNVRGADGALFDMATQIADTLSRPFLLTVPTISMHYPYTNPGVPSQGYTMCANDDERAYMDALNYFDTELARFLSSLRERGLYDSSVIIIASDHRMNIGDPNTRINGEVNHPIAFIALNTGITRRMDQVAGQADFYPTVLDIMGVDTPGLWRGVGTSMLDPSHPGGAIDTRGRLHGNGHPRLQQQRDISDLIINSDYFSTLSD